MTDKEFLNARIGQEVAVVTGPGRFPTRTGCSKLGFITAKVENRWGRHFELTFTDGSKDTMHSIMSPDTDKGIGCYLLDD